MPETAERFEMIKTLTGKNSFLLQRRLRQLTDEFLKTESDLALERIDAGEAGFNDIIDAVQSMPFLADRKMVVLRQPSLNKEAVEKIEQLISAVSSSTDVIIVEPGADKRTGFYKLLKSKSELEEFTELEPQGLASWLVEEAKNGGGKISMADAGYLVERVGPDNMMLAGELEKLLTYHPEISRADIDLLTEKTPQSKVFDLLDATFGGDKKRALELYEEQRAQKVEPQAILALLAWQLNIIALAKLGEGKTAAQIAKDAKLNPYPVTKAQGLAKKINREKLNMMINDVLMIDYRSKSTGIDVDESLKTYITTL